ncbi:magnesium transporter CorA family protein [Rhodococcus sp. Q]|uniref:magnesium transporter CorA family protein n=1 Tax=Rhodococcus sp. Q TaxID=2502252 RepID=UPI0010F45497|nr:magnesium transporter CorA family protein [Rhodococcus sp. Q]
MDTVGAAGAHVSCAIRNRLYVDGKLVGSDLPLAELASHRSQENALIWVDLLAPSATDIALMAPLIGGEVALHHLAIESVLSGRQRPRLVRFRDHSLLHCRAVRYDTATDHLEGTDLSIFVLARALITIRGDDRFALGPVLEEWDDNVDLVTHGVGFLLHTVLDAVVDGFFEVIDTLDDRIQTLEDDLLLGAGPKNAVQLRSFVLRKAVAHLGRAVLPMNEAFSALLRQGSHVVAGDLVPYYQDVYDHTLRATERIDGMRDTIESILATHLAMQGNSLNETMKKLTAWAAIIAIPTGVTGYFGQNVPFPGFGNPSGFWFSLALLLGLGFGLYWSFKRRDWL